MNPRASASFCHCPKLTSAPSSHDGPSWVSMPYGQADRSTSLSTGAIDGAAGGTHGRRARQIADADRVCWACSSNR